MLGTDGVILRPGAWAKDLGLGAAQSQNRGPSPSGMLRDRVAQDDKKKSSGGQRVVILSAAKDLAFGLPFRTTVESKPRSFGRKNSPQDDKSPKRRSQDDNQLPFAREDRGLSSRGRGHGPGGSVLGQPKVKIEVLPLRGCFAIALLRTTKKSPREDRGLSS